MADQAAREGVIKRAAERVRRSKEGRCPHCGNHIRPTWETEHFRVEKTGLYPGEQEGVKVVNTSGSGIITEAEAGQLRNIIGYALEEK